MEHAVGRNFTRAKPGGKAGEFVEKKIMSSIIADQNAAKGKATVTETADKDGEYSEIKIVGPPLDRTTP